MGDQKPKHKQMSCGIEINDPINLLQSLHRVCSEGYHFVVTNLIHPYNCRDLTAKNYPMIVGRTDRILTSNDWGKLIVGKVSKTFLVDSEIEHLRVKDKLLLKQELRFAGHLILPVVMMNLSLRGNRNLAHIIYNELQSGIPYQIWFSLDMTDPARDSPLNKDPVNTWELWNEFRRLVNYHKKMALALVLPKVTNLPSDLELKRWCGEPVKALIIHTSHFILNQHNQPVLPRVYQDIIKRFMALDVQYIIQGPSNNFNYSQYCNYINYLGKKLYDGSVFNEFSHGCEDFLQNPLQPLSEHLEASIYEIFEKDPIKYIEYQNAMKRALEDMPKREEPIVIMVVGAGRGPLVQAALNAAYLTERQVKIYAVEKNPFAINTLEERIQNEWGGQVTLIHQDMRICRPPEDADILVSELLGSFGDNELSPECLDGAQRFLKKNGVSIPQSYTSYLAPLQSTKLFNELENSRLPDKSLLSVYETPYVVHFVNAYSIAPTQPLFTFEHPNWSERIINERVKTLKFNVEQNCVLTGLAGYFETILYKDVMLSTNPETHTPNMVSWFPIMFPISEPIQVKKNDVIEITFWRAEDETKVWYEWCLNSPFKTSICNVGGRSYFIKK